MTQEQQQAAADFARLYYNAFTQAGTQQEPKVFCMAIALLAGRLRGVLESLYGSSVLADKPAVAGLLELMYETMRLEQAEQPVVELDVGAN